MTNQEAIKRIEEHVRIHFASEYPRAVYITEALNMAVEALKAQEPILPIRTDEEWQCGNCKSVIGWDELQVFGIEEIKETYCHNCGRKVKWE